MGINRLSSPWCSVLLIVLLGASVSCARKTVAATATTATTTPSRPPTTNDPRTDPQLKAPREESVVAPDPDLSGRGSAKLRQVEVQKKAGPTEVFTLRKTPCYGNCPVFRLRVLSDGTVYYSGIRNVKLLGEYQSSVAPGWVDRLQRKAIAKGVFSWSDTYPEDPDLFIVDASNTITTVVWNSRKKTITHNYDAPPALEELEKELIGLIDELKWSPRQD